MSQLDWKTLQNARIDAFTEAAERLKAYALAASEAEDDLLKNQEIDILREESEAFSGVIADQCRAQAARIAAHHAEDAEEFWNRMARLLDQGAIDFGEIQDALIELFGRAGSDLTPTGGVGDEHFEVQVPHQDNPPEPDSPAALERDENLRQRRETAVALSTEFKGLMESAREVDDNLDAELRALDDSLPERPPAIGGSDFLDKAAIYDAERAAELLVGGDGVLSDGIEGMSQEELNQLNDLFEYWSDDPVFSSHLLNLVGPEQMLFTLTEAQVAGHTGEFTGRSVDLLEQHLGEALAVASDPSRGGTLNDGWATDLMNLGDETIQGTDGSRQTGYEALAPLLQHGEYATDFIVPIADHILALDNVGLWSDQADDMGHGGNPVDSVLTALDRNPDAALDFFSPESTDLAGMGIDGQYQQVEDPLSYLGNRLVNTDDLRLPIDADLVGNAIESAATGLPSGTELSGDLEVPTRSAEQAAFTERLIDYALVNENAFTSGALSPMMDNLGDVTALYMADFHQALGAADGVADAWQTEVDGTPLSLAEGGTSAESKTFQWFKLIGHDDQAMATAWAVSEGMMYGELLKTAEEDQWKYEAEEVLGIHAHLTAALTCGGLDGVADSVDATADQKNAQVDLWTKGANFGAGYSLGTLNLSPAPSAALGVIAGEAINFAANELKTSPNEVHEQTTAGQSEYYDQVRGAFPQEVTQSAVTEILSAEGREESDVEEVVGRYSTDYSAYIETYLAGQEDEAERHQN